MVVARDPGETLHVCLDDSSTTLNVAGLQTEFHLYGARFIGLYHQTTMRLVYKYKEQSETV